MNAVWMDAHFMLDHYQESVLTLVWLLATFTCLWVLASLVLLYLECDPSTGLFVPHRKRILHKSALRSSAL